MSNITLQTNDNTISTSTNDDKADDKQSALTKTSGIYTMQEWLDLNLSADGKDLVIGTPENAIIRPRTKNLIEAAEKSFKTTFLLRLLAGLSCGETVFPELPVVCPRRVLYVHGELTNAEIKERTVSVANSLTSRTFGNFWQGRATKVHLIDEDGREKLRGLVEEFKPDDLAIDPWQSFIAGVEENSSKPISEATAFCNELVERYGVTLWIPIHQGKNPDRGARGHSHIAGWRDTRIELKRTESKMTVKVEPRWGTTLKPFNLRFRDGTLWSDEDVALPEQARQIREFVEKNGGRASMEALREHLGGLDRDTLRKRVERAVERGAILKRGNELIIPLTSSVSSDTSLQ
jgi:hypothetical protein